MKQINVHFFCTMHCFMIKTSIIKKRNFSLNSSLLKKGETWSLKEVTANKMQ